MKRNMEGLLKTVFLLMAQYDGRAIIPVEMVCRDYFPHLTINHFVRKATRGEIKLPLIYIEPSQKAAKGIHVHDLAEYIDARRKVAKSEMEAFLR
ncbi:pyocin activator PrtN family protein [Agrobacterium tumefaciens]|jgi:UDP-N-acetylglucosamine:LPS N-acetylglucosamine transferase|uniref:pyocin activator PrtN family protein n=1 Tax=Agrobacterium tumefaciens TaxID=358 RepID=UPI003A52104E